MWLNDSSATMLRTMTNGRAGGDGRRGVSGTGVLPACTAGARGRGQHEVGGNGQPGDGDHGDEHPGAPGHRPIISRSARCSAHALPAMASGNAMANAASAAGAPRADQSQPNATEATSRARLTAVASQPQARAAKLLRQHRAEQGRQHAVGGGIVAAEQDQHGRYADRREVRHEQQQVDNHHQDVSRQEHLPPRHAIRQRAERHGQQQVDAVGADIEQRDR